MKDINEIYKSYASCNKHLPQEIPVYVAEFAKLYAVQAIKEDRIELSKQVGLKKTEYHPKGEETIEIADYHIVYDGIDDNKICISVDKGSIINAPMIELL